MKFYHVDSFTTELFKGNPAGVCLLGDAWLPETQMQQIAMENNMSETAFVRLAEGQYHIRWFTPNTEAGLCGHATLAAAHVLFNHEGYSQPVLTFQSVKGPLHVEKDGDRLVLDFPMEKLERIELNDNLDCFDIKPLEVYKTSLDYLFVYDNEDTIVNIKPDLHKMKYVEELDGIIITAPGKEMDFVSRCFGPKIAIDEDPVTGSAHTIMTPYWQKVMGKDRFEAAQLSARSGRLSCQAVGDRVKIGGYAVTYLVGEILL